MIPVEEYSQRVTERLRSEAPLEVIWSNRNLKLLAQDHVQMTFEFLQGWRLQNIPG